MGDGAQIAHHNLKPYGCGKCCMWLRSIVLKLILESFISLTIITRNSTCSILNPFVFTKGLFVAS